MASPPAVIFVHGIGLAGEVWSPQLEWCLSNSIDAVAITLPGHGSQRSEVADVECMIRSITIESRKYAEVILVGHSLGGWLCCKAAIGIPNLKSVILVNPLIELSQHRRLFILAVKAARLIQRFTGPSKRSGDFREGSSFFWRAGIYPYCLVVNDMEKILSICKQIEDRGDAVPPDRVMTTIVLPRWDEMLSSRVSDGKEDLERVDDIGHIVFRSRPESLTSVLARHIFGQQGRRR